MPNDFSTYDAYLGSLGVIFFEDEQTKASTSLMRQEAPRQDTRDNPDELRPDFGDHWSQSDFSHGSGQEFFHRPERDARKFFESSGFDISRPGRLRHLRDVTSTLAHANIVDALAQCADVLFAATNASGSSRVQKHSGTFPGSWTAENPHNGESNQDIKDLAARGDDLFVALGTNGIHLRAAAGTYTHYSNVQATRIAFVKQRLLAVDGRSIYEVTDAVPNGTLIETLPAGWRFQGIFEAGAFIYACAAHVSAGISEVRHYGLNQSLSGLELKGQTPMPQGQLAQTGAGYLNQIWLGARKPNEGGGSDPVVYQGFADAQGFLNLVKLVEDEGATTDLGCKAVLPFGEQVLFGFSLHSGSSTGNREGLGVHHIGRDALALHLEKASPNATAKNILSLLNHKNRIIFVVDSEGVWYEDKTKYKATATLIPSAADFNNAGMKVWDQVEISYRPLPTSGAQVVVQTSVKHPDENVWTTLMTDDVDGSEGKEGRLTSSNQSRVFALKIISSSQTAQASAPEIIGFHVRANAVPTTKEYRLSRYIRILAKDQKDDYAQEIFQNPRTVKAAIEALAYTWITFTEDDRTWTAFIESVAEIEPMQPVTRVSEGETHREAYVMELRMVAS